MNYSEQKNIMAKVSYKINRLINPDLQFGLKNSKAVLTGATDHILSSTVLRYDDKITSVTTLKGLQSVFANNHDIVSRQYVDLSSEASILEIKKFLEDPAFLKAAENARIAVTRSKTDGAKPTISIALTEAYTEEERKTSGQQFGDGAEADKMYFLSSKSNEVIDKIILDKFGAIRDVKYKTVSAKDLTDDNTYDNYKQWSLLLGENHIDIESSYNAKADKGASNWVKDKSLQLKLLKGLTGTIEKTATNPVLSLEINHDKTLAVDDSTHQIGLSTLITGGKAKSLYYTTIDQYGRINAAEQATAETLISNGFISKHTSSTDGIVQHKDKNTATASTGTFFYTSDAKWATIPYNKVDVGTLTSGNGDKSYSLLFAADTAANTTTVKSSDIKAYNNGILEALYFQGNGSKLTNISAGNIVGDKALPAAVLPESVHNIIDSKLMATATEEGKILSTGATGTFSSISNPSEAQLSKNYVLAKMSGSSNTSQAVWTSIDDVVKDYVSGADGMRFKGVLNDKNTLLNSSFQKGDVYKVGVNDLTIHNTNLDIGDTIYATDDKPAHFDESQFEDYFAVVENNIDNPAIMAGKGTSGRLIITSSDDSNNVYRTDVNYSEENGKKYLDISTKGNAATATTLETTRTLWGQDFNGSKNIDGNISNTGNITSKTSNTYSIGTSTNKYKDIYATTLHGALDGNASTATQVNNSLIFTGYKGSADAQNITFNGSTEHTIDLSASGLGFISSVADGNISTTGNALTGIVTSTSNNEVKITPSKAWMLASAESTLFKLDTTSTAGTLKLSYLTELPSVNTFYTANQTPTSSTFINFNGGILAKDLKIVSRKDSNNQVVHVAQNRLDTLNQEIGKHELLAADTLSNEYGFIKTGFTIAKSTELLPNNKWNSDVQLPTAKAVSDKIETVQATIEKGAVKCVSLTVTKTNSPVSATTIPANAVIDHVDIYTIKAFDAGIGVTINAGTAVLVKSDENVLDTINDTFDYKISKAVVSESQITATLGNKSSADGEAKIYVYYTSPLI